MSLFQRMERKLERTVNGVFARAFRSEVQPLELASALRRAMDDRATMLGRGRTVVPNLFTIELAAEDHTRLTEFDEELEDELVAAAQEHVESQRYQPGGPIQVLFVRDEELETGVFRVRPATSREHVPRDDRARESGARHDPYASYRDEEAGYDEYSGSFEAGAYDQRAEPPAAPSPAPVAAPAPTPAPAPEARQAPPSSPGPEEEETTVVRRQDPTPGPPAASVHDRPWLEVGGERYPLIGAMTVMGRDQSADIVLEDPGISRRHCELRITHDGPRLVSHLRDLGSTNGTYVNGERTDATPIADGDRITVGRTHATFHTRR